MIGVTRSGRWPSTKAVRSEQRNHGAYHRNGCVAGPHSMDVHTMRHVRGRSAGCCFATAEMLTGADQDILRDSWYVALPGRKFIRECLPGLSTKCLTRGWRPLKNGGWARKGCKIISPYRLRGVGVIIYRNPDLGTHIVAYENGWVYDGDMPAPCHVSHWVTRYRVPDFSVHPWCDKRAERVQRSVAWTGHVTFCGP